MNANDLDEKANKLQKTSANTVKGICVIFLVAIMCVVASCSDKDNGIENSFPIKNVVLPPTDIPISSNDAITILGEGFTESSSIWLKSLNDTKDISTTITEVTSQSITFLIDENIAGLYEVFLKQDTKDYSLGKLIFEVNIKHTLNFYTVCYDDDRLELAEIDIENGALIWTGIKIPNYAYASRGYVYDEGRNEFITMGFSDNSESIVVNRVNMSTKNIITKTIDNTDNNSFDEIIKIKDKFYTVEYSNRLELAEIDIENGALIWTGIKIPNYAYNSRGYVYDEGRNEFITLGYSDDFKSIVVNRVNMSTKNIITKTIDNVNDNNFSDLISW